MPRNTPPSSPREVPLIERLKASTAGRYSITAELGVGGMATVFRATEIALEREVAIKVMSLEMSSSSGAFERFRREARVAAALSHPHIVPIYAIGEDPSLAYFAMKFIEGHGLDSVLKKEGAQSIETVVATISVVGKALNHAHLNGVVHRDVKPANIMIGKDGWVYVTDFGIAKRDDAQGLTQAGTVIGTPAYMSPEQFNGQAVTGAADQYSLGIVAYEMLAGRTPFDAPSLGEIMRGHLLEPPPPLRTIRMDLPTQLADVVVRMLAKDPTQRFPTLGDAVSALEESAKGAMGRKPALTAKSTATVNQQMNPTTPIPRTNPGAVISGAARRPVTGVQRQAVEEEPAKRGGFGIVLLFLALVGGGAYFLRDKLLPEKATPLVVAPPVDSLATITPAPAPAPAPGPVTAESTATASTAQPTTRQLDSVVNDIASRLASAPVIDGIAPPDSVILRVGSQTLQTVLFVNDQQVGIVGGQGLVPRTVAPGQVSLSVRRLNCQAWDTTFIAAAGKRYTFVERSPRC